MEVLGCPCPEDFALLLLVLKPNAECLGLLFSHDPLAHRLVDSDAPLPTHLHPNTVAEPRPASRISNLGPPVYVYHTGVHDVIWVAIVTA
jgi:hypothetical protein